MVATFKDRTDAGVRLAGRMAGYRDEPLVVFALPRGGIPIAKVVAESLGKPFDLLIPRKIGHPLSPEYAICAVTEDGHLFCSSEAEHVDQGWLNREIKAEAAEAKRRRNVYLADRPPVDTKGKVAVIIDDGIATGLTMRAAIAQVRAKKPDSVIVAVPVAPPDTAEMLRQYADEVIAVSIPQDYLDSIGSYYQDFPQLTDKEVMRLLQPYTNSSTN